jgi:hypothetical protein
VIVRSNAHRTVAGSRLWTGGVAPAAIYLAIGVSVGSLLSEVARSATRRRD